jgi:polar amino acid transport system substrate-binding protein
MGVPPAEGTSTLTVFPGYGIPGLPGYDETAHEPNCGA